MFLKSTKRTDSKEYDTGGGTNNNNNNNSSRSTSSDDDNCLEACAKIERDVRGDDDRTESKYTPCCLLKMVVAPVAFLIAATSLLLYFLGGNSALPQSLQGIVPDLELFRTEDPLMGELYAWRSSGGASNAGGLELTLLNCLDDEWHPFFDVAVEQWDNGSPDTLTLNTLLRSPDPTCTRLMGVLKVCNGDYGATDWIGVNEILIENDLIVSSTAKMNEYHFGGSGDDPKRQYTMCHEL